MVHLMEPLIESLLPEVAALRQRLHQCPEVGFELHRTSAIVREELASLPVEIQAGVAQTGVVAVLEGRLPGPTVALRADMDALPLTERTDVPYRSQHEGRMHACGHDGHTAILLGAAKVLAQCREHLRGQVKFIFQPAEEGGGGGKVMCEAGVLKGPDVDVIYALHSWPDLAAGEIGVTYGPMLAAADTFELTVRGEGAHGAKPHQSVDPIFVSAKIIDALQGLVSRETDPVDSVVITVGQIRGGTAANIIPDECFLRGTIRTLRTDTQARVWEGIRRVAENVGAAFRASVETKLEAGYPALSNQEGSVDQIVRIGEKLLGAERVIRLTEPSLGAEDFAFYLQHVPGALFRLGVGPNRAPLHSARFDFNDAALKTGLLMMVGLAVGQVWSE